MNITTFLLYTCGGFAFLTSLHHFFISLNGVKREEHFNIGIVAVAAIFYTYSMEMIYSAETVDQILKANKIQMFCVPLFFIFYGRFASYFCNKTPTLSLSILSIILGVVPFVRMFSEGLLTYINIRGVKKVTLFWGEQISQLDCETTLFASFYYLLIFIFVGYLFMLSVSAIKTSEYRKGKALLATLIIFILCAVNDVLVDTLNLNWMYLGEYGFILIILVISFYLSKDVYRASVLQSKVEESEKLLATILENAPAVISIKDLNGKYLVINDEFEKVFNLDKREIINKTDKELFDDHLARSFHLNMSEVIRKGEPMQFEEVIPKNDGPHLYISNKFPVYNKDGEIYAVGSMSTDISDKRNLEIRLRQSEKMQAVGQLAGGVAHDFNNQLAGIIGYSDMIKEKSENDASIQEYVKYILTAAKRSSELTDQLLAFARKGKYQSVIVNIHEIIDETIALLKRSISKKIELKENFCSKNLKVLGDATQLQNVILNLAVNSCDAMDDGGELIISTELTFLDNKFCKKSSYTIKPGMFIQITVEDDGQGIPQENLNRIFEPFFTTKEPGQGTGMGLSAAYGTIKNHNGAIDIESEINEGTKIIVYLPEAQNEENKSVEKEIPEESVKGFGEIVVIDDESVIRRMISRILPSLGYNVKDFEKGTEAIEYYRNHYNDIDLVIVDMIMPEMDGKDVFKALYKINPNVKILLSSGFSIEGDAQKLIDMGAQGFIHKPYRKAELSRKVAEILKSS